MKVFFRNHTKGISLAVGLLLSLAAWATNPFSLTPEACITVAVAILMVVWWITEAAPMPVVALVPLLLLPLLGVSRIDEVAKAYSNPVIFLFMGGFLIGLALEKWNLHKRIALRIVSMTGTSGNRIILGFILATAFLSMWLSNTATTMMMFPIAMSVITVMRGHEPKGAGINNFALTLMLVIAYASNIGGMSTVIGTPPNVAFVGFIEKNYGELISFAEWMLLCTPLVLVLLSALYLVLTHWLWPNGIKSNEATAQFIRSECEHLGRMSTAERRVLAVFAITALLWISRGLITRTGLITLDDNLIAIAGGIALFLIPAGKKASSTAGERLLSWSDTTRMAWGILLLFGGGIALAGSLEKAGVMELVGNKLALTGSSGPFLLVLIIVIVSIFLSELMSNVAQVIVLAPVVCALADALQLNPLLLGIPMTLAASAASMLPMGTPPNAIVFGSGFIGMKDMLRAGLIMNLISILIITLFTWFLLPLIINVAP